MTSHTRRITIQNACKAYEKLFIIITYPGKWQLSSLDQVLGVKQLKKEKSGIILFGENNSTASSNIFSKRVHGKNNDFL